MEIAGVPVLTAVVFLPAVAALFLLLVPGKHTWLIRMVALAACVLDFAIALPLYHAFDASRFQFQFVERVPWMADYGIYYHLGIDGLSLFLVLLTAFLGILAVWFSFYVNERVKEYMICLLVLQTAMLGVFCALDLVLFYVFWEATLVPMYFLIAIWGSGNKRYAAIKFFLYTFTGSIFMLLAIVGLYLYSSRAEGAGTFDLVLLQQLAADGRLVPDTAIRIWLFLAFGIAFAVKVPMFPFHTWLPDAHTEAPTAGSVILAGVLLKMGAYGFLRYCLPLFPDTTISMVPLIMVLSVIAILYGAIVAAVQTDVKRLVAFSSVSHLGFVTLGLFSLNAQGMTGSMLQQVNHGISTGALFLLVGMLYERRHTRLFTEFGGLKAQMPVFAAFFLIFMLSSVGLPSMNGFIGEFLVLLGTFQSAIKGLYGMHLWMAALAASGVILAAVYLLWMFQKVFLGPNKNPKNHTLSDIKWFERIILASLVVFVFWLGLYPKTLTDKMEVSVQALRLQVTRPEGQRPVWSDAEQSVTREGELRAGVFAQLGEVSAK
ncbi:MAG: NADH-quinone oxidoreductase subunit M [Fimbriimonadia bacterium]|jgi:NADH-quinone oxidoreductase subunit M